MHIVIWGVRKAVHHLHHFVHQWEYIGCHGFAEFCHAGLKKPLYIADYCRPMPSFAIPRHDFPTMKNIKTGSEAQEEAKKAPEAAPAAPIVEEKIDFSNVQIEPLFEDFVDFDTFSKSDFRAVKVLECEAVPKSKKLLKFTLDDGTGVNRTILSGIHAFYEPEELVGKTLIAITNLPPRPMMGIDSCGMLLSAINKRGEDEELHLLMVDPHIPAGTKLY